VGTAAASIAPNKAGEAPTVAAPIVGAAAGSTSGTP
jgi:hypothetical protein